MRKTKGNKVSTERNSSFACFALGEKTISVGGQTTDSIHRYGKKRSRSGSLATDKITSAQQPVNQPRMNGGYEKLMLVFSFYKVLV